LLVELAGNKAQRNVSLTEVYITPLLAKGTESAEFSGTK
jgi:hypothetical protein